MGPEREVTGDRHRVTALFLGRLRTASSTPLGEQTLYLKLKQRERWRRQEPRS